MSRITVIVDGVSYTDEVEPRTLLVHYLRETVGKTGTVVGCDTSNCGACTVHLDGTSVKSCNVLAVLGEALDRGDLVPVRLDGEDVAGLHAGAVEVDRARPAVAGVATDDRAGLSDRLS